MQQPDSSTFAWLKALQRLEEGTLVLTLLGLSLLAFAQALARYLFDVSFTWFEELSRYLGVCMTFLGAGLGVKHGLHFSMDFVVKRVGARTARAMRVLAALMAASLFLALVWLGGQHWAKLMKVCRDSAILSACLLFILACSMTSVWLLTAERIPVAMADWIVANVQSGFMFLVWVSLLFLLLGMVMDDVSAMTILAPIFGETLHRYGIDLVHFGIVMVLLIEYGFLTPPFGLNLFVTMGLTGESLTTVSRAVLPFLLLLLFCVALVVFVPEISLLLPKLLLPHLK